MTPRVAPFVLFAAVMAQSREVTAQPEVGPPGPEARPPVWVALDRDLRPLPCAAVGRIDATQVVLERDGQEPLRLKRESVVAIVPAAWVLPELPPAWSALPGGTRSDTLATGLLVLTDGTRLVGGASPERTDGETLGWSHGTLSEVSAKLDTVRSVFLRTPEVAGIGTAGNEAAELSADRLTLVNGDVLTGLVTGFSSARGEVSVGIEARSAPGKPAESRKVPLDRVSNMALANPSVSRPPVRVWLEDGSVVGGAGLSASSGGGVVISNAGGPTPAWPMVQVRALSLAGPGLTALADLAMTPDNPRDGSVSVGRDEARPAVLGAESIRLRAPGGVTLALPPGARRVSGSIVLPEECREWGDLVITISAGGKAILTQRVNAGSPFVAFNSTVSGSTLRIALDPGEGGAIQDEVVVQHGVVISDAAR